MESLAGLLDPAFVRATVASLLTEDVGRGDVTTRAVIDPDATGTAAAVAREAAVVAGLEVARACFEHVEGSAVEWDAAVSDGERVEPGATVVRVGARLTTILTAERTALNLLGRMCGVATTAAAYAAAVEGTPARVVDTRKTMPGLRVLDKYAVRAGGCNNHRFGLDDGILVKDNHIAAAGGIAMAVRLARKAAPHGLVVEVEVDDLDGLDEALAAGADAVLLDNMDPGTVAEAVTRAGGKVVLEASGGITLDNIADYAATGVDLISVGALTHSARNIDLSLEMIPAGGES